MSESPLIVNRRGRVLDITLNRPPANAIDAATSRAMGLVFAEFRDDPDLRVAVLTGGGDKFFCAGWDLKAAAKGEAPNADFGIGGFGGLRDLKELNKPVIAAVNGICIGGGFELALSADLIYAADNARFCWPGVNAGAITDFAATTLPHRIPYHFAMELLLTGRWVEAAEGLRYGFVNHVVPAAELKQYVAKIADHIATGAPIVQAAIKDLVRRVDNELYAETFKNIHADNVASLTRLYVSDDLQEGARAFVEKRKPQWKGV